MRAFVILCLVAVASAQYDYSPQGGQAFGGYGSSGGHGGSGFGGNAVQGDQSYSQGPAQVPAQAEYNKEFYSFAANDNDFRDGHNVGDLASSLKKNLRVIFIKGPENSGLEDAALQLAKSAGEQRTAIYVLNKQADLSGLANKLNSLQQGGSAKPEVHFVKYRTQADADNAQRAIQSHYDSTLPGPSHTSNGGQAQVHNYASQPAVAPAAPENTYIPPQAPASSYLPPGRKYFVI